MKIFQGSFKTLISANWTLLSLDLDAQFISCCGLHEQLSSYLILQTMVLKMIASNEMAHIQRILNFEISLTKIIMPQKKSDH